MHSNIDLFNFYKNATKKKKKYKETKKQKKTKYKENKPFL